MNAFGNLKKNISLIIAGTLTFSAALQAEHFKPEDKKKGPMPTPWLTGPLLTSSGHVIPEGHYNFEPYVYVTTNFATYNKHWHTQDIPNVYNVISQNPLQFGLPANFDFQFFPQFSWNHTSGASEWVLNDMGWGFDYQLLNDQMGKWWPAIKLSLRANFPIGKYQKLHPNKKGMDIGGTGDWEPGIGIVMSRLWWFGGHSFLSMRWSGQYTFATPVHVKNFNAYGGGHHTRGKVFPGQNLELLVGMEYTWTQRWAVACDLDYSHTNKTRFKGRVGKTNGVRNVVGGPSSEQFSIAPAIEYNWSYNVGIIAGAWFTVAGRNTVDFASAVVAINIYK